MSREHLRALGRDLGGQPSREAAPAVQRAVTTLHLLLATEDNAEVVQVIEELQRPILGQWECAFLLQVSPQPRDTWLITWHSD